MDRVNRKIVGIPLFLATWWLAALLLNPILPILLVLPSQATSQTRIAADRIMADSVKREFLHAWNGYKKYAWGYDALKPLSKTGHNWYSRSLLMTPVDSYDLLLLMGLNAEADSVKRLILDSLTFDVDMEIQAFEVIIRILGGLISAYEMNGDEGFRRLAVDLADRLLPIYNSKTGIPYRYVNLRTGAIRDSINNPAEIGTALMEFGKISIMTGNPIYYHKAKQALKALNVRRSDIGLVGTWINAERGEWVNKSSHIGGAIDSYYEYLVKCQILFGDEECGEMWESHRAAVHRYLADTIEARLWYGAADMGTGKRTSKRYGALHAFFPAVLCLEGDLFRAKWLQQSSYDMWNLQGIEPEAIDYSTMEITSPGYPLRPEIVESAWYLRLYTGSEAYRDMGRKILGDLVRYCRTDVAYAHLADVRTKEKADAMESFFFAETIKYLYLLFTDRLRTPDDVVFNTEAHPFKVLWNRDAPGPVPPPDVIRTGMAPAMSDSTRAAYEAKLADARTALDAKPGDPDLLIWVGRRMGYLGRYDEAIHLYSEGLKANPVYAPLYRHRGHRYITVRMFDRAIADFESAARLVAGVPDRIEEDGLPNRFNKPTSTLQTNIYYHLGLAYYLKGDFASAERNFRACVALAKNDDMRCAASDWLYMSCRRQGKDTPEVLDPVLAPIHEGMTIYEDSAYFNRLLMYKGLRTPESLMSSSGESGGSGGDVMIATYGYGVGNWHLYNGRIEQAREIFERLIAGSNKAAFGLIAAEADLARGLEKKKP